MFDVFIEEIKIIDANSNEGLKLVEFLSATGRLWMRFTNTRTTEQVTALTKQNE